MYDPTDPQSTFAGPKSFIQRRADKVGTAKAQPTREMLVELLRQIDTGELEVQSLALLAIVGRKPASHDAPVEHSMYARFGGLGSQFEFSGLLTRAQMILWDMRIRR